MLLYHYLILSEVFIMKKSSTLFLKVIILLIGIGALALLIKEPQIEGRNVNADRLLFTFGIHSWRMCI